MVQENETFHQFDELWCHDDSAHPRVAIVWRRPGFNDVHDSTLTLDNTPGDDLQSISCEAYNTINSTKYSGFRNVSIYVQGEFKYVTILDMKQSCRYTPSNPNWQKHGFISGAADT